MKKVLAILICIACICLLVCMIACNNDSGDGSTDTATDTSTATGTDTGTDTGSTDTETGSTDTDTDTNTGSGSGGNQTVATGVIVPVIKYLRISSLEGEKVAIRFNAIGKNLNYEVRYSQKEITAENFEQATLSKTIVVGTDEVKTAVISEISADANNQYYVAVRASNTNGIETEYSDVLCVRAGGIQLIKLDPNKIDAFYLGEVIKDASALIDEQSSADPYYSKFPSVPVNKISKYYWAKDELVPGSYVPQGDTSSKYGITLRPILDLETEHYVECIYLYYGTGTYPVTINASLDAAKYDIPSDWDININNFNVDTSLDPSQATVVYDGEIITSATYQGKSFTLVKQPIGFNGVYEYRDGSGKLILSVTFNEFAKEAIFRSYNTDSNGNPVIKSTVEGQYDFRDVDENPNTPDEFVILVDGKDENGRDSKVIADFITVKLDSNGLPTNVSVTFDKDNESKKETFTNIAIAEQDRGETGTYIGTDLFGNESLTVVVDGTQKAYKPMTFTYTDPSTGEKSTLSVIYTISKGKLKLFEDNRPAKQGWTRVDINAEVRYIQICYNDTEPYHGSVVSEAPIEVLVYGYATGAGDEITKTTHDLPLIKDFMGACGFTAGGGGNTSPVQLACFGVLREYVNLGWVYSNAGFPGKAATIANSSMADFDHNYGSKYSNLIVIPCLQWNEGSNPARYYDRITGKLNIEDIASEEDKFKPETYAAYADVAYQYAARYGSSKMGYLYEAVSAHSGGTPKVGLNYLQWIELGNEPNGEDQNGTTPYQLAALTSAAYDGHQRTILTDVWNGEDFTYFFGAKTADPDFKVAMAGLAGIGNKYISSMVYWMKANRTDGKIAMDAFNVHTYFGQYFTLNGQQICVGVSPEQFGLVDAMSQLVEFRDKYYPNVEVWLTEFGWDTNQSYETMTSAHAYADYSGREIQAMWLTRAYLLLAASGVDKATMYMCEDMSDDRTAVGKYGTCGIYACDVKDVVDEETGEIKTVYNGDSMIAKESYYLLYTLKYALGDMRFNREISSGNPDVWIYEFTGDNGERGYAVWCPTSNDTRVNDFQLYIDAENATLITNNFEDHRAYKDQYGNPTDVDLYYQTTGDKTNLVSDNGFVSIDVSENPVYVIIND